MLTHLFVIFIFYYYPIQSNVCYFIFIHYSLYNIICSLCLTFLRRNNYLFVLLKYLFPVAKINYGELTKNNFFKILLKYRRVWSCFEDLVIREFYYLNLIWMLDLILIAFFYLDFACIWVTSSFMSSFTCT